MLRRSIGPGKPLADPTAVLGDEDSLPAEPEWSDFSVDPDQLDQAEGQP